MMIEDIMEIPFRLTCLHLQCNSGGEDQHVPLTRKNFRDWAAVESMLSEDRYMVIEVKNKKD